MKPILPFKPTLSCVLHFAGIALTSSAFAGGPGLDLTFPDAPLDEHGHLIPQGSLSDNTVSITGGTISGNAHGANTTDGDTVHNRVFMTGGTVTNLYGAYSGTGTVEHNSVLISGGTVDGGTVDGGTVDGKVKGGDSYSGDVRYNSVTMTGETAFDLIGGSSQTGTVEHNSVILGGGMVRRQITGGTSGSGDVRYNSITMTGGSANSVYGGYNTFGNVTGNEVLISGGHAVSIIGGISTNGGTASGNHVLILGGIVDSGVSGVETFLAMEGSHSSYDTGSHVDQDGYSGLADVSAGMGKARSLVLGGFFESGWGSYTAHNAFADAPFVRASGDTSYYGGGLLTRWELTEYGLKGIALEASFRAGRLDTDYHSGDLTDGTGNASAYNLSSHYYGGHVGAAYARELGRKVNMEAYGRFLWTRQDGDHATISGERHPVPGQ